MPDTVQQQKVTTISKITPATLRLKPALATKEFQNKAVFLATIIGEATGIKEAKSPDGAQIFKGATGAFEGVNIETGDVYRSGVIYLPGGAHDMLITQLEQESDLSKAIYFGVELWAVPSNNPRGYSWELREIAPIEEVDPLARARQVIEQAAQKQGRSISHIKREPVTIEQAPQHELRGPDAKTKK